MVIAIHCLDFCQAIHGGNLSPRGFIPSLIQRGFLSEKSRRQAKDLHERGGHGWCVSIYVFFGQQLYQKWIVEMWRIFGWTIMILGLDQLDHEHIEAFSMNFWILPMMMVSLGTGLKQRSRWFSAAEEFTMTLLALLGRWWGLVHQNMGRFRVSGVPQQKMVSKKNNWTGWLGSPLIYGNHQCFFGAKTRQFVWPFVTIQVLWVKFSRDYYLPVDLNCGLQWPHQPG